ncbi:hypothetical protein BCD67_14040 [Oscillatoriales cyanobacterium USR001]|nr:hypothetical protein BCD67_14040 [Oscillatoriales cyanobacterium USR001]
MRVWQIWSENLILATQYNPPRFIELVMLTLALILLGIWSFTVQWPYLVLCLSYVIGSSFSILIRESFNHSPRIQLTQVTAVLLLIMSFYSFATLIW